MRRATPGSRFAPPRYANWCRNVHSLHDITARRRKSDADPLDRSGATGEEVRLRPLPRFFGPAGRGADHEAIPPRPSAGGRGLAMARDRAACAVGAGDPADPHGVAVLRGRPPLRRGAAKPTVVLRELRLGRRGVPRDVERRGPDRDAMPSLRGTDCDHPREWTGHGHSSGADRPPLPSRLAVVERHREDVLEPHGLLPKPVSPRRLAGIESGTRGRGAHGGTNARAQCSDLSRQAEGGLRPSVEGRTGRTLQGSRPHRRVLGSLSQGYPLANEAPTFDSPFGGLVALEKRRAQPLAFGIPPDG